MTIAWVLGSQGLLGSSLSRMLREDGTTLFVPPGRFQWANGEVVEQQIRVALAQFAQHARQHPRWAIYWAAGVGTMGSTEAMLTPETHALSILLKALSTQGNLDINVGSIAFASSAGAIYAGATKEVISESTPVSPNSPYAREKLAQENLLHSFAATSEIGHIFIARISTLYGIGQGLGKKQGLLTHLARSMIRRRPIQIFVPLDTVRDYITADDAAAEMVAYLELHDNIPRVVTKIVASEQPVSIAQIVSIFKRVMRQTPRIATSASPASALYAPCVQFRSSLVTANMRPKTSLVVGIAQLVAAERALFAQN